MAVAAKDGSMHHSAGRASLHNMKSVGPPKAAPPAVKPPAAAPAGTEDVSAMPIKDVVKKHGPAHEIHMTHDHEAGQHHVHSMHGDKNHHSDHEDAQSAHDHAAIAGGAMPGEPEESPDDANAEPEPMGGSGGGIPGMNPQ